VRLLALAAAALVAAAVIAAARPQRVPARPAVVAVVAGADALATGLARGERVTTVAHVLATRAGVTAGGLPARVAGVDRALDLARLDVPGLRAAAAPPVGGLAVLVLRGGRTVALPALLRRRITARLGAATRPALDLDVAIEPGDSGAPVVAPGGRLLGFVFARSDARTSTAYAVDVTR
jgi:S1-C subfamily serine protease